MTEERREFDHDHDLLVEIHTITKELKANFVNHMEQDKNDFDTVHKRINGLSKYVYIGIGGIAVLEFVLNYINK